MFYKVNNPHELKPHTQYLGKLKAEYPWFTLEYGTIDGIFENKLFCYNDIGTPDDVTELYSQFEFHDFAELYELPN